jgi:hypothetical protein
MNGRKRSGKGMGEMPMPLSPGGSPLAGSSEPGGRVPELVASPDNTADLPAPELGERYIYFCEPCSHRADATFKVNRRGREAWYVGSAHVDRCPREDECLDLTAKWLSSALGREIKPAEFKEDPRPFLAALAQDDDPRAFALPGGGRVPSGKIEEPRLTYDWEKSIRELRSTRRGREARDYLRFRGIDPLKHALGHTTHRGYEAFVARCYVGNEVVTEAFRWYGRRPSNRNKNDLLAGCRVGWIGAPVPPQGESVLLVAGFFDAFSARQRGFPAISAVGTNLPDHLMPDLAGKTVVVAFDVGEESAAKKVTEKLRQNGIRAQFLRLERLRLPDKGDLALYFQHGGSRNRLTLLINEAQQA